MKIDEHFTVLHFTFCWPCISI